ncbi:hypothetical protein SteCoe_20277 [Stentor coeruleus]|uniref:Large ribosomal subunit protein uL11 C-terminal domain-containing protein n=1 Tax=Stentor coeruleus TaxID=5963 RepID=A0A1R2BSL7_9CILI|nr:hypothetical protein SteCoe_20277 [Stentor coeruleus]
MKKTYKIDVQGPPTTWMIKKASRCPKGSPSPYFKSAGVIAITSIYEIAKVKKELDPALKDIPLQNVCSAFSI